MLIKNLNIRDNKTTLKPESNQDLWTLRRIIEKGDIISSRTKREVIDLCSRYPIYDEAF